MRLSTTVALIFTRLGGDENATAAQYTILTGLTAVAARGPSLLLPLSSHDDPTERIPMLHRLRADTGSSAVEFALVVPLLVLLVVGIVEFGRGYNVQNTLSAASREAVRAVALSSASSSPLAVATAAVTSNTSTVSGTVAVAVTFWTSGTATAPSTPTTASSCASGLDVHVNLNYPFTLLTTEIPSNSGVITMKAVGVMRCGG